MARKKRTTTKPGGTNIVIRNDDRGPITRRTRGRRGGRRRSGGGGGGGNGGARSIAAAALAGAGFGLLEKVADNYKVPSIPLLGKKGTIAIAAYMLRRQHPLIGEVAYAGFVLAGFELVREGKVSGEDEEGNGGVAGAY